MENEQSRLFSLLNELPAIVYLKAPDHTIRFANRRFRARFGDPAGELCYRLIHNRTSPCDPCSTVMVLEDKEPREWERAFPDGRCYRFYDYPFIDVDGAKLVLQLGIDITERIQAEAQLERTNKALLGLSRSERKQRLFAESLVRATLSLNTSLELNQVLDGILEQTQLVLPAFSAAVLLLEEDTIRVARHRPAGAASRSLGPLESGVPLDAFPLLKASCRERQAILVQDTMTTPTWQAMAGLDWVRSLASVPIVWDNRAIGLIALLGPTPDLLTTESVSQLQAFAAHAALAIQNARLFEEMRAGREQLQLLSRRLVEVQEQERRHVARELHDEASNALTSLRVQLKLLERQAERPQAVREGIATLLNMVEGVMEDLHRLAVDLRPASLDHLGLVEALRQQCQQISDRHGLLVDFEALNLEGRLPAELETALYRITQEALSNSVRHARADHVGVILECRGGKVITIVEDDGVGFDPGAVTQGARLGLLGMRERAESLGGALIIESSPRAGTTVLVEVPYAD